MNESERKKQHIKTKAIQDRVDNKFHSYYDFVKNKLKVSKRLKVG